jgi:bifunctional UDP-N-acetylglucosamine pyrophosphorylase/glucosamine-1-phosphate N-acetyltransferase
MIRCVYDSLNQLDFDQIIPIVGYGADEVLKVLPDGVVHRVQEEQLGTGHAVMQASDLLKGKEGLTFVIAGDQPLITPESISRLLAFHVENKNDMTLMTAKLDNPYGYGRIIRDGDQILRIVEQKDATNNELNVNEVNISVMLFDNEKLFEYIDSVDTENKQGEYYLTDMLTIFNEQGFKVGGIAIEDNNEAIGVNDKVVLAQVNKIKQEYVNEKHMLNGVTIVDPQNTYIGEDVVIGADSIIFPGSVIYGVSEIGTDSEIRSSYIMDSKVGNNVTVGPFAHLRGKAVVGDDCRIGNFVEIKKSTLANEVKAAHLAYVGDAEVGTNVNIGCGVITVNYDGVNKHKTIIHDNAFVGSNVNLIAPVTIGANALLAAGSTIHDDVPADALAIARNRQTVKKGYKK